MGFSTKQIAPMRNMNGELTATDDPALVRFLGQTIKLITVGREYRVTPIWNESDDGRMFLEYNGMFAEFEQLDNGIVLQF